MRTINQVKYEDHFNKNNRQDFYKTIKDIVNETNKKEKYTQKIKQNKIINPKTISRRLQYLEKKHHMTTELFSEFIPKSLKVRDELYDTPGTIYHSIGKDDFEKWMMLYRAYRSA